MVEMNMRKTMVVEFTPEQLAEFQRPIVGAGGGQQFVRACQEKIKLTRHGGSDKWCAGTLTLVDSEIDTWFRYRDAYGSGGFQSRLGRGAKQETLIP